jgi:hypothetical protein
MEDILFHEVTFTSTMKKYDKTVKIEVCETVSDNELHTSLAYHLQKILQNTITRITSSLSSLSGLLHLILPLDYGY